MTTRRDLHDRTALVTGASDGVGLEIARALASAGARVIMPVRDPAKGRRVIERIRATQPGARLELRDLDLARMATVAALADEIIAEEEPIDLLVLNAGVVLLGDPERHLTADGFEAHLQTNFLGHYALTRALLPLLRSSKTRIAVQCSLAAARGRVDWADLQRARRYSPLRAYAASKMLLGLFGVELARRSAADGWGLTVNLCHPGVVPDTGIARAVRAEREGGVGASLAKRLGHAPDSAAESAIAALFPDRASDVAASAGDAAASSGADAIGAPARMFGPSGLFGMGGAPREIPLYRTLASPADGARAWRVGEALTVGVAV